MYLREAYYSRGRTNALFLQKGGVLIEEGALTEGVRYIAPKKTFSSLYSTVQCTISSCLATFLVISSTDMANTELTADISLRYSPISCYISSVILPLLSMVRYGPISSYIFSNFATISYHKLPYTTDIFFKQRYF